MVSMLDSSQFGYGSSYVNGPYGYGPTSPGMNYSVGGSQYGGMALPSGWGYGDNGAMWNDGTNLQYDAQGRLITPTANTGGYGSTPAPAAGGATGGAANPYGGSSYGGGSSWGRDPNSAPAIAFLNNVIGGNELPMGQAEQDRQLSQQSGMASSAEAARNSSQMGAAAANGASVYDPSLQGARLNNMATRQAANMNSQNRIAQGAANANFGARMEAAGTLAGLSQSQAWLQGMGNNTRGSGTSGYNGQFNPTSGNPGGSGRVQGYPGLDWADSGYADGYGGASQQPDAETPAQRAARLAAAGAQTTQSGGY